MVLTGLSGSGKSSLAFDTIYAEGQRRYVESLSSYARHVSGPDGKARCGLYRRACRPAISIDQKTTSKNPRSTVGTVTEIYDYLRLLYARIGMPHCPMCGKEIKQQTVDQIVDQVLALPEGTRIQVLAPVVRGRKGEHQKEFEDARASPAMSGCGWTAILYDLDEDIQLEKNKKHTIEIVVDRLVIQRGHPLAAWPTRWRRPRACPAALVIVDVDAAGRSMTFSQNYACPELRRQHGGADAPDVLLQQPLRRLPQMHRPGHLHED